MCGTRRDPDNADLVNLFINLSFFYIFPSLNKLPVTQTHIYMMNWWSLKNNLFPDICCHSMIISSRDGFPLFWFNRLWKSNQSRRLFNTYRYYFLEIGNHVGICIQYFNYRLAWPELEVYIYVYVTYVYTSYVEDVMLLANC